MSSITKLEIYSAIGSKIKEYRVKNNMTQEELAEKLNISVKYVSRIENGNGGVKLETLINAMNLLGLVPNIAFFDLIKNDELKLQLFLSSKVSELSNDKIEFLLSLIDSLKKLDQYIVIDVIVYRKVFKNREIARLKQF